MFISILSNLSLTSNLFIPIFLKDHLLSFSNFPLFPLFSLVCEFKNTHTSLSGLCDIDPIAVINGDLIGGDELTRFQTAVSKLRQKIKVLIKDHDGTLQFINDQVIPSAIPYDACNDVKFPQNTSWPTEPAECSIRRQDAGSKKDGNRDENVSLLVNAKSCYLHVSPVFFFELKKRNKIITPLEITFFVCNDDSHVPMILQIEVAVLINHSSR